MASELPELWINPWAVNPIPSLAPFAAITVDDSGDFARTDPSTTAAHLFGLSPNSTAISECCCLSWLAAL